VLQEATAAYEAGRMSEALGRYEAASKRPDGQQLRIYSGLYLTQSQLGRTADAEKTFGTIARLGLETNNLSVKFLFKPGSTDFLADPKISAAYPMWLRQIARQAAQIDSCVVVTGHTSRTGSESVNERLSLQRAVSVKSRLVTEAPPLAKKLRESGMGFRENIVGTGADDASDALDRRVEFKVVGCKPRRDSGREPLAHPVRTFEPVAQPVVQPALAALPELPAVRHQAVAAPVRRTRRREQVPGRGHGRVLHQHVAAADHFALRAGPGADARVERAAREVGVALVGIRPSRHGPRCAPRARARPSGTAATHTDCPRARGPCGSRSWCTRRCRARRSP
jgi:outer membrane protein OmpA-like peptidoglycan-associated protein